MSAPLDMPETGNLPSPRKQRLWRKSQAVDVEAVDCKAFTGVGTRMSSECTPAPTTVLHRCVGIWEQGAHAITPRRRRRRLRGRYPG